MTYDTDKCVAFMIKSCVLEASLREENHKAVSEPPQPLYLDVSMVLLSLACL